MYLSDKDVEEEFDKLVNEVRQETHWGDAEDSPVHYFGFKTQRGDELFTVTDWGHVKSFIRTIRAKDREAILEKIEKKLEYWDFSGEEERYVAGNIHSLEQMKLFLHSLDNLSKE